jgi:mono/diheme cytochrome c family protein
MQTDMRLGTLLKILAPFGLAGGSVFYALTIPSHVDQLAITPRTADLANGETMFYAGGCASCHAVPKQKDQKRLGGGLALTTAFGTFMVPNISPDPTNGIGSWSEQEFATAMLKGVGRNGEHFYPAFPYTSYQRMKLEDVRDLYAFLRTLPADPTPSRPHNIGFPFDVRRGLGLWKLLYLDGEMFRPDPTKSKALNRGAYLVEGPGHCAECHSPRNALGAIDPDRRFAGGPDPTGKGWVPNITPHDDGLAKWSAADIAYLLETGIMPDADSVGSTMADVVRNTAKLKPEDRAAIAAYLKSLPPRPGKRPASKQ